MDEWTPGYQVIDWSSELMIDPTDLAPGDTVWILRGIDKGKRATVKLVEGSWTYVRVDSVVRRYRPASLSDRMPCPNGCGPCDWHGDAWACPVCGDEWSNDA